MVLRAYGEGARRGHQHHEHDRAFGLGRYGEEARAREDAACHRDLLRVDPQRDEGRPQGPEDRPRVQHQRKLERASEGDAELPHELGEPRRDAVVGEEVEERRQGARREQGETERLERPAPRARRRGLPSDPRPVRGKEGKGEPGDREPYDRGGDQRSAPPEARSAGDGERGDRPPDRDARHDHAHNQRSLPALHAASRHGKGDREHDPQPDAGGEPGARQYDQIRGEARQEGRRAEAGRARNDDALRTQRKAYPARGDAAHEHAGEGEAADVAGHGLVDRHRAVLEKRGYHVAVDDQVDALADHDRAADERNAPSDGARHIFQPSAIVKEHKESTGTNERMRI